MYNLYPQSQTLSVLTYTSLQTQPPLPVPLKDKENRIPAGLSRKQELVDTARSPPVPHPAPPPLVLTPKPSTQVPFRHPLRRMAYLATHKRLLCSNFQRLASLIPTTCQRQARSTSPPTPPIRPTPSKAPCPTFRQPTLTRLSVVVGLATPSQTILSRR